MIKRRGQQRDGVAPPSLKRMSDTEYTAYSEAFGVIKGDYQTLCLIGDKLRAVETTARGIGSLDSQAESVHAEFPDSAGDRSPWEVCASLMRLDQNEVLLCKRVCEHGLEYAVIDHAPAASAYAKAHGALDILRTGDNPRQVLRDYLQSERETLQLMASDITANVRLLIAERFPRQDLRRVVNEIEHMCKRVARLGFSDSLAEDVNTTTHKLQHRFHI
ncbi:MAG TPA: hypothetical protein VMP11_13005 [Verrucomicrobiae bacterium]|nr:hypothetical protein [Verrucomicrobiae bacterium]